jgi:hypothetical protein
MARKSADMLLSRQKGAQRRTKGKEQSDLGIISDAILGASLEFDYERSWAALGVDTSMTACSVVGIGFDNRLGKMVGPEYAEIRWTPEDDYFKRLAEAAKGHELILDEIGKLWVINSEKVHIAIEEPWYFGATKKSQSAWLKQQAEIAGAFKGGLARYGFLNIYEINNSQWRAVLRRDGVTIAKGPEGKWDVKAWAIKAFGLPDLPDLVKSKSGAKIVRPESGYGANAKPVQPNDIYDAAACCAWMSDWLDTTSE